MWWDIMKKGDQDSPEPGGLAERNIRAREEALAQDKDRVKEEAKAGQAARQTASAQRDAGAQHATATAATTGEPEFWPVYCERCQATGPANHECIAIAPPPPRVPEIAYQARGGEPWIPLQPYPSRAPRVPSQAELAYTPLGHRDQRAQRDAPTPASSLWSATPPSTRRSASTRAPSSSVSSTVWPNDPASRAASRPPMSHRAPVSEASPWRAGDGPANDAEDAPWLPTPPPPVYLPGSRSLTHRSSRRREGPGRHESSARRESSSRHEQSSRHERPNRRPSTARKLSPQRRNLRGPRA